MGETTPEPQATQFPVVKGLYPSAEFVQKVIDNSEPKKIGVDAGKIDHTEILVIPKNMQAVSLKKYIDEQRVKPERRVGTHTALDLDTFSELTNRFKSEESAVFAKAKISGNSLSASLLSVLDFHPRGEEQTKADNGKHKVIYQFPISKELTFWMSKNGAEFGQTDFAMLLEERIGEMGVADESVIAQIKNLKPRFADPLEVLSLSRDLEIYSNTKIRQAGKLQSGERKIEFEEAHVDASGKALSLPDFFLLQIPVFVGGPEEKIIVSLRYRKKGDGVVWFYNLYRIDQVFQTAFETSVRIVKEKTALPLYLGEPAETIAVGVDEDDD